MSKHNLKKIVVFYDGTCGLCHWFIRFILTKMGNNGPFIFSPQSGVLFRNLKKQLSSQFILQDSIIVYNECNGEMIAKTKAVICILNRLNWPWKGFEYLLRALPSSLNDFFYDCIARIRHRLFKNPTNACPLLPKEWKKYFKE